MPNVIYLPQSQAGISPAISSLIESFKQSYLSQREKEEQANRLLLQALMEYGGVVSPEQMGKIERSLGFRQPGVLGRFLGLEETPTPLRSLFQETPEGYRMIGRPERELETYERKLKVEEPFKERELERRTEKEKELIRFRTDEEFRAKLKELTELEPKRREQELKAFADKLDLEERKKQEFFDQQLERAKKLKNEEEAIRWEYEKKKSELEHKYRMQELNLRIGVEEKKEKKEMAKERKQDYYKTLSAINTAVKKLPGEEMTEDELETVRRIATNYGFNIKVNRIKKPWYQPDTYTYELVDPLTNKPVRIYEENIPSTTPTNIEDLRKKYNY